MGLADPLVVQSKGKGGQRRLVLPGCGFVLVCGLSNWEDTVSTLQKWGRRGEYECGRPDQDVYTNVLTHMYVETSIQRWLSTGRKEWESLECGWLSSHATVGGTGESRRKQGGEAEP